jgi:putative membrane protein
MYRTFTPLITAGLVLALGGSAAAQTPPTPRADQPNQKAPASAMNADQDFAQKAATGGKHEVEGAKFAAGKATNAGVKSFANKLVKDHTAANNELKSLMKKKNITAAADDKPAAEAWRNETGAAFDRAFIDHAIAEHEKDIAAFEAESKDGSDADLKAWAGKKLPTLREHLKEAQDLKAKLQTTTNR